MTSLFRPRPTPTERPATDPPAALVPALASGALAGRYVVDREIGRGGMGIVYLARDIRLQRQIAIKLLVPPLSLSRDRRTRFLREARLMAGLSHPHIVPVFEFAEEGEVAWFAMDYVRGESAATRLRRDGALPLDDACRILLQVASALDFAHARGITHRDIKPDNILIDGATGRALLADFGVAIVAGSGLRAAEAVGTVLYMAPEWLLAIGDEEESRPRAILDADRGTRAGADRADTRGDVYSLGITAFELLTGRVPFSAGNAHATALQHLTREAPDVRELAPHIPASIATVIARCLEKEPGRRWESASAFATALGDAMRDGAALRSATAEERGSRVAWFDGLLSRAMLGTLALAPYAFGVNALVTSPVTSTRLLAAIGALAVLLPLLTLLLAAPMLLAQSLSPRAIVRLGFRQPRWWLAWWPAALRHVDTLWHRLPIGVRIGRSTIFLATVALALTTPALLLAATFAVADARSPLAAALPTAGTLTVLWAGVVAIGYASAILWSRRRRLAWSETSDLFLRDVSTPALQWRHRSGEALLQPREAA